MRPEEPIYGRGFGSAMFILLIHLPIVVFLLFVWLVGVVASLSHPPTSFAGWCFLLTFVALIYGSLWFIWLTFHMTWNWRKPVAIIEADGIRLPRNRPDYLPWADVKAIHDRPYHRGFHTVRFALKEPEKFRGPISRAVRWPHGDSVKVRVGFWRVSANLAEAAEAALVRSRLNA